MVYRKYTATEFTKLRTQHNIMALVGNGFDIQVMREYEQPWDTRYETFYHYLKFRNFDEKNLLLSEMSRLLDQGRENWSDIEGAVGNLINSGLTFPDDVFKALSEIQQEFSSFLNQVASASLLDELGADAMKNRWGTDSLSNFIFDFESSSEYEKFKFPERTNHYDLYNFLFVNFNYTPLLDGYVYLDQNQFDPHPHKYADRHFMFYPNPRGHRNSRMNEDTAWSSYVQAEVVHPHGTQGIPRSLLFGIDSEDGTSKGLDPNRKLKKPFWAQNDSKFAHLFEDTDLFIVFGCSLGESDGWWWRSILRALRRTLDAELIIYQRHSSASTREDPQNVRRRFLKAAGSSIQEETQFNPTDKIHVISYDDGFERTWLDTSRRASGIEG